MPTTWVSDGTQADIAAKLTLAADGDTITLPAGTHDWPGYLQLTKAITLQGAAPTAVASISSVSTSPADDQPATVTTASAHGLTSGDAVWITGVTGGTVAVGKPSIDGPYVATVTGANTFTIPKNVTVAPTAGTGVVTKLTTRVNDNASTRLMQLAPPSGGTLRVTQIEFLRGSRSGSYDGVIEVVGINTDARRVVIDKCSFQNLNGFMLRVEGALGVAADNVFRYNGANFPFYVYHRNWNGGTVSEGSWSAATNHGSGDFWFIVVERGDEPRKR